MVRKFSGKVSPESVRIVKRSLSYIFMNKGYGFSNLSLRFSLYFSARDEAADAPNWGRELSVIDMLRGSDGHVYKGRFRQVC